MKKVLLRRYGALGDFLHASHLPRLLKEREGFDHVAFEYNLKGIPILSDNPFIDRHIIFDPSISILRDYPVSFLKKRLQYMGETGGYDKVIDLQWSLENGYIAMENMSEFYLGSKKRRELYGKNNYYDQSTIWAGYPQHIGMKGELYFTDEQEQLVQGIYEREYKGKFVIICNLSGSSKQKLFYNCETIMKRFLDEHKDSVVILMGDNDCKKHLEFDGERIVKRSGIYPIKQSFLMTKYANLTIGYESGLMIASTLLGTPTIQLMTSSSPKNHGGDFPNDYSLQSPIECSPCHKGVYKFVGCPTFKHLGLEYPKCIRFDTDTVIARMNEVYYDNKRIRTEIKAADMSVV